MIEVKNLCKSFEDKEVLKNVSVAFKPGMVNLIIGRSGAGKTVFLKCLFGLNVPTSGEVLYDHKDLCTMDNDEAMKLRGEMGVLFQGSALFDSMTILENVRFPLDMFSKMSLAQRNKKALHLISRVGLQHAQNKYPSEISGGMMKRCGIARALINDPKYLFCDEPNSGLDPNTSELIDELLLELTHEKKITTIINTHDMNSVKNIGENIIFLHQGEKNWEGSYAEVEQTGTSTLLNFIKLE